MKIKSTRNAGRMAVDLGLNESEFSGAANDRPRGTAPGLKLNRILVPIDFSACSTKALRYALPLAKQFGARLSLIYVGQQYYFAPELEPRDLSAAEARARANAAVKLMALATDVIALSIPVDFFLSQGNAPTEILNTAKEVAADLIIISPHAYNGLKHSLFGSISEKLVRYAPCPVLVVREKEAV